MPNGSNRTEKQHYVPRVYLKGFAPQYLDKCSENSKSSKIKYCVFYYDLQERTQSNISQYEVEKRVNEIKREEIESISFIIQ